MKRCTDCQEFKPLDQFHKDHRSKDSRVSRCKFCVSIRTKQDYKTKSKSICEKASNYYKLNRTTCLERISLYAKKNRSTANAASCRYRIKQRALNPGYYTAESMRRHAAKMQRYPKWLTKDDRRNIRELYKSAREQGLVVDHIIPLRGKTVSGLHVPWNLQLLTEEQNRVKSNHLI